MGININRLMRDINDYAEYGHTLNEGITRPSFSEADYKIREIYVNQLKEMDLEVKIDPIANIWAKLKGIKKNSKTIVIGSHLDTVPNGGRFDGALGVLTAKEVIQTIIDQNIQLNHNLEIVSFTAEEPNEFNLSTMGSRALTGKLTQEQLLKSKDTNGTELSNAVIKAGGNLSEIPQISRDDLCAFIELHIEQGKRLENKNLSIGIVDSIVGIYRDSVIVEGAPNHSGTTMMKDRQDALTAASEMVLAVEEVISRYKTDAVATIGKFDISPNAANIIPGSVNFILEIRSKEPEERKTIKAEIYYEFERIQKNRCINFKVKNILDQNECNFDSDVVGYLQQTAQQLEIPYMTLPSMAGHDATHLAEKTKTAMIFVKSINGKSHCPEELSLPNDIEKAANTMLNAVLLADKEIE